MRNGSNIHPQNRGNRQPDAFPPSIGMIASIADPQQFLPLSKVALEAHALGDSKRYNHAPLDLPAGLSGSLGSQSRAWRRSVGAASGFSVTFGHEVCA